MKEPQLLCDGSIVCQNSSLSLRNTIKSNLTDLNEASECLSTRGPRKYLFECSFISRQFLNCKVKLGNNFKVLDY